MRRLRRGVYWGAAMAGAPVTPALRGTASGFAAQGGTSWSTPAAVQIGDLIVALRLSSGGGVQGMGTDFTTFGDTSGFTCVADIYFAYRIATAAGVTAHTVPTGGNGVAHAVWQAGTFDPVNPISDLLVEEKAANTSLTLAARDAGLGVGVYGNSAIIHARVGDISETGEAELGNKTDANPYGRFLYRAGGWAGQTVSNAQSGSSGQFMTPFSFTINPRQ